MAIFGDLQPLWSSLLTKPDFLRFRCFSGHVLSKTKSVTPYFFYISDIANSSSLSGKIFRKKSMLEKFRANVLKVPSGMLSATAKTRQLLCGSGGDLRTPTSQVCRAGGYESICQRHFDRIHREDKTCSHPSLGGTRVSKTVIHLPSFRINLLAFYHECRSLIGYATQLVVYYQYCVLIGWATSRLFVIAH